MNLNEQNLKRCMITILTFMGREPRRAFSYDALDSVLDAFTHEEKQWSYNEMVAADWAEEASGISLNNNKYGLKLTKHKGVDKARRLRGSK